MSAMPPRTLELDRRIDALLAWHSFFDLTPGDQRPMFARFAAHAAPRSMLMFTKGTAYGENTGYWRGEPLYHGSLDPDEFGRLLHVNGFALLDHRAEDPECGGATVWLARFRS